MKSSQPCFNEQISGVNEQIPGRGQNDKERFGPGDQFGPSGAFSVHGSDEQIFGADKQVSGRGQSD